MNGVNKKLDILGIIFWIVVISTISLCLLALLTAAIFPDLVNALFPINSS